jgi:hypothetical protein
VAAVWGDSDQHEQHVASVLMAALASIGGGWATWRAERLTTDGRAATTPEQNGPSLDQPELLRAALAVATATAQDGRQRALDSPAADLHELQQLRLAVRQAICSATASAPLRRVLPWLWNAATSTGHALATAGDATGYELRLSRYQVPIC